MDDGSGAFALKPEHKKTVGIFTIGHSNRSLEEFLQLLKEFKIKVLVDIRRYPRSRKFPHFNGEVLRKCLVAEGIEYLWLEALGGHRHTSKNTNSPNTGIKSLGFRNYADHMITDESHRAVQELLCKAAKSSTAIMCAEKFYWKCHRRFLSDYLVAQGVDVEHIIDAVQISAHKLTPGAVITAELSVIYPAADSEKSRGSLLFDF